MKKKHARKNRSKTAEQLQKERNTILRNKVLNGVLLTLFIAGLLLLIWEITIYRHTIIDIRIPLIMWLSPGIILTPLLRDMLDEIETGYSPLIMHYFIHTCTTGAFLLFTFMAINFYISAQQSETKIFTIIGKGQLVGGRGARDKGDPYVIINYKGLEKELFFTYPEKAKINSATKVVLSVRKGYFGFDVVDHCEAE